ncbi:MAG TPA: ABC transporter transmembrane domain-containing protein [Candidatus Cloacimonas sp.]|jgi:ATP-binding cassette subfamily B multidrug efflux pump|nr:ATP-binding cassette domain-containing protein [Candidatus Cloacimonas sp.]MDD2250709.1 ABC transporter transmembrane domain-containing protein [Candidatus Cloacimonadota bacterium]MDD3734028.1 ABC transporter transmembrane domain-containing protein [Candidatus Cloacimonadota bacterium]HNV92583.1 ABC transporter transmembrane domain-containing protein [Candidatus Cloacimonas sp.]HNZ33168.1 ABC transporter transmembrane domain-containing protein [Candidatus Cloacimonas sp.]
MIGGGGGGGHSGRGAHFEDELKNKIYDRRLFSNVIHYIKPYLKWVILSFLFLMLISGAEVIIPLIQRSAIDDYIVSDKTLAIFTQEDDYHEFINRYQKLGFKEYKYGDNHFLVISSKDRNKMDRADLEKLKAKGILKEDTVFLVSAKDKNISILKQYLPENINPEQPNLTGWFKISSETIAIPKEQLKELPKAKRLEVRSDASKQLLILALIFLAIITLRFVASYFQTVFTAYFSQTAMADLRHDVFAHLQKMPTKFFDTNPVGRLVTRVTNDIAAIDEMLASGVITIIQDVVLIITIVILMLALNWHLALVSFSILPLVIWVIVIFRRKTRVVYREVRKHLAVLNATLAEHIEGQKIIQLFNQYFHKRQEFADINQKYYLASIKQIRLFAFFRPIIHVSSQIAVALIIWYGGGKILQNVITIGLLMAFTQYIQKLFEPINDFSEKFNFLQSALASAERIFNLLALSPDDYREEKHQNIKLEGEIEFENVWLAYNENEWVLKDISFKVAPGEKIALVGHTGSGKTSIVNLILGMYPYQKGRILIDGKDIHNYSLADLRRNVGIVQQDVFLFSGNIKDNIALNNDELSDEEIIQVAKYVNADKFISKLPNGYNEPVMERGATLSTGQRQLIAFARVLAYNPSIFILDEATSNIDTETELLIQDALNKIIKDRTSIIIAHRLSTIQNVDRILVLHKGEIVEEGSHFELLDKQGLYYDLYRLQYT